MVYRNVPNACPYCGSAFVRRDPSSRRRPTKDHIKPHWDGGTFCIFVCWECNNDKGHMFLSQWIEVLRFRRDPRVPHVAAMMARYTPLAAPNGRHHPEAGAPPSEGELFLAHLRNGTLDGPQDGDGKVGCEECKRRFTTIEGLHAHISAKHRRWGAQGMERTTLDRLPELPRLKGANDIV